MPELDERLRTLLGDSALVAAGDIPVSPLGAPRSGKPPRIVLRPKSTAEVSAALRLCFEAGQPVIPWGGRTGLVEGTRADDAIALSLERMNRIEEIDVQGSTMTVEAGCVLQNVCEAAENKGLFFPLDLGARGSATIGGNISTNAGGNRVIRYGMMRDQVLGLEVVLADGTVMSSLNHLIKNNAGYDLKHIFIGSEGTLGVVTRAVLRLRPKPVSQNMAFLAVDSFEKLPTILRNVERGLGGTLSAFEVLWDDFYRLVTTPPAQGRPPVPQGHAYYVLIEAVGGDQHEDALRFERVLAEEFENGSIADATIAKSKADCDRLWALRDDVLQVAQFSPIFAFDVSLKIADMKSFVSDVQATILSRWPAAKTMVFGHMGDGNLHLCLGVGDGSRAARHAVEEIIYGTLRQCGGSVSAEHGIGLEKRAYLSYSRTPEEIALMRTLKHALDPRSILNPGKIFAEHLKRIAKIAEAMKSRRAVVTGGLSALALPGSLFAGTQFPVISDAKQKLVAAYPQFLARATETSIVWRDGTVVPWDDGRPDKSFEQKLANASLADQMSLSYRCGPISVPPAFDDDPGRFRNIPFFKKMYGEDEAAVRANLKPVPWRIGNYRGALSFTRINGVDRLAERIVDELAALPDRFVQFLVPPAGSFNWRAIAGTEGLSAHAFGIAVDINAAASSYWRWDRGVGWRNRIPFEIVDIFERHGFIWGGKWYHYDTMHFEYRPELIAA